MLVERLYQLLEALPNREAEQALVGFRANAEAWDICLGIVHGSHGPVPDSLTLFAAQTLHACARRVRLAAGGNGVDEVTALPLIGRQQALLSTLVHIAHKGGREICLICAALAALSVRNYSTLRDVLCAALQRLPQWLAVQLLLAMAEEGEALQAPAGAEVEHCAATQHTLREEVGPQVFTWLAGVAATTHLHQIQIQDQDPNQQQQHQHQQQQRLLLPPVVRCFGAWSRLGCLHAAACPTASVRELLALLLMLLRCGQPTAVACSGTSATLRHDACEALGDVIEHGPDALLRELQPSLVQLAAAAAAAAAATIDAANADAAYDIVQLVASYASARLGELVAAVCGRGCGGDNDSGGGAGTVPAPPPLALVEGLCQLAALPAVTLGGYPVCWPSMQVMTDLALGCIAAVELLPRPLPATAAAATHVKDLPGGTRAVPAAASFVEPPSSPPRGQYSSQHQHSCISGFFLPAFEAATAAATAAAANATSEEHCVPDVTLGPRHGLPPQLLVLYDNLLHSVLSCCVAWGRVDAADGGTLLLSSSSLTSPPLASAALPVSATAAAPMAMEAEMYGRDGGGATAPVGLMALPPECVEALRGCLQACAGIVGQVRQIQIAVQLLQYTAAAANGQDAVRTGQGTSGLPAHATAAAAALTAALAGVAACGTLPLHGGGDNGVDATAAAAAAAGWILLAAADYLRERAHGHVPPTGMTPASYLPAASAVSPPATPTGLAVPLTLYYCEAVSGCCEAVLKLHVGMTAQPAGQGPSPSLASNATTPVGQSDIVSAGLLYRLAEPALAGLQLQVTAAAAARALRAMVSAARQAGMALPFELAAALVDSAHHLPYDAGPDFQAAEREYLHAVVAAAAAASGELERLDLFQRLLSPALSFISQTAAAVAATQPQPQPTSSPSNLSSPWTSSGSLHNAAAPLPPLPAGTSGPSAAVSRSAVISSARDGALTRQLRLLEAALAATGGGGHVNAQGAPAAAAMAATAAAATVLPATAGAMWPPAAAVGLFVQQVWPPMQVLLQRGAAGRFLQVLCRCLTAVLHRAATGMVVTLQARPSAASLGVPGADLGLQVDCGGGAMCGRGRVDYSGVLCGLAPHSTPPPPSPAQPEGVPDPWVASVLEALATCVGRPGAKHVYEPLVVLLEACTAAVEQPAQRSKEEEAARLRERWRQRHAALVACTIYGILHGRVALELAASWQAADSDPDSAECLLRLATAVVRCDILTSSSTSSAVDDARSRGGGGGAAGAGSNDMDLVAPRAATGAVDGAAPTSGYRTSVVAAATAALRLAAASSGCNHRQVSAAALACTCAVLEAACGPQNPEGPAEPGDGAADIAFAAAAAAAGVTPDGAGGGGDGGGGRNSGGRASTRPELLVVVTQLGPMVTAGLLAALLSSSPLPRLQRVATALVLLSTAVAHCYIWEQQQQRQLLLLQQQLGPHAASVAATAVDDDPATMVEACGRVLSSWLVAAAAALQLPERDGAALATAWGPLLAEAGVRSRRSTEPFGADIGTAPRGLSRRLWRQLREFAESRLRALGGPG